MASDLEAMYPKFAEKIRLAREYGYSDDEIEEYFRNKISEAFKAGYSAEEINEYLGVIPKTSKKKAVLGAVKDTAKSLSEGIVATTEAALSLATGAVAYLPSVLGGIAKNITSGPEEARKTEEAIARTFTYAPRTEAAQRTMELLGKGMEFLSTPARKAGEALGKIGLPQAGYSAEKALELLTFSILGKVLPKIGKTLKDVDIPLMKQKIETAKKAGYSEAEIANYLEKNPNYIPIGKPADVTKKVTSAKKPIEKPVEKPAEKPINETPEEIKSITPEAETVSEIKPPEVKSAEPESPLEVSKPTTELTPPEPKSTTKPEPTELHAGTPIDKVWQSWMAIDRGILGDFIHKTLDDTAIDRFMRRFADNEGMRYLPLENKNNLLKVIYGPEGIKGKIAKGERITQEFLDTLSKETQKGLSDAMFIRYMEDPKYRMAFDQAYPDNPLKVIQEDIKTASENLVREGIITVKQHRAWGDKYLSRVYLALQEPSEAVGGIRKIKTPEIGKGRKIESIMDAPKQLRDELGFVEDAKTLLPLTRFKQYMPSAVNSFAKGVIEDPAMVFAKDKILVKLPEGVNNAVFEGKPLSFPEYMSPYYAKKVILPAIRSLVKEGILKLPEGELKAFISEIKAKSKALEELKGNIPSDYVFMPEAKGYGNLAGLPVSKDVQNVAQSLRVIQNPAELASKLDKYVTAGLATFKMMKVPFGLTKTIMRNFLANYPQWVLSGADPIAAWKEIPKAIKDIASKSERWKKATDAGLFKSNWFDAEILRIFDEMSKGIKDGKNPLKVWSDIMRSKPVELVGKVYGAIDDVWRMARYNYAIDVEKLPVTEAVIKANRAHYDYSLTYAIIQAMRDPDIHKSPAWKILGSVFPTYSQKTLGLLYQALKDHPLTTIGAISLPFIIKEMVEEKQRRKYGKKYGVLSDSIPDWQKDPDTVTVYDPKEKKLKVVHLDWLLPWGQWASFVEDTLKGDIKEAIQDIGGISSPLLLPSNLMRNEDIYTGREIYDPTQSQLKQVLQILGYVGEKTIEPDFLTFLRRVFEQKKRPTEITLRSLGIPYFEYDEKDLMLIPAKKIGKLRLEINLRVNKLTNNLQRGLITEKEFAEELRRLYEYQKEKMKEIVEPLRSKKEE